MPLINNAFSIFPLELLIIPCHLSLNWLYPNWITKIQLKWLPNKESAPRNRRQSASQKTECLRKSLTTAAGKSIKEIFVLMHSLSTWGEEYNYYLPCLNVSTHRKEITATAQVNQHVVRRWVIVPTDHRFKRYLLTCSPLVLWLRSDEDLSRGVVDFSRSYCVYVAGFMCWRKREWDRKLANWYGQAGMACRECSKCV